MNMDAKQAITGEEALAEKFFLNNKLFYGPDHEIVTTVPVREVVATLEAIASGALR